MSREVKVFYCDDQVEVVEPDPTFEEIVEMYGKEMVRKEFVDNVRYRNKHPRVYKKVAAAVKDWCPPPIKSEQKNAEGVVVKQIYCSDLEHVRRALDEDFKTVNALFQRIATEEPLFVRGERGNSKVSDRAMRAANNIFASDDESEVEDMVKRIESFVPGLKIARDSSNEVAPESLARGIQSLHKYIERQAKEKANQEAMQVLGTT